MIVPGIGIHIQKYLCLSDGHKTETDINAIIMFKLIIELSPSNFSMYTPNQYSIGYNLFLF